MRSFFLCLATALLALSCAAPALAKEPGWGRVYTVSGKVVVRESPVPDALQVRVLKSGQKVRVDFEEDGWAAVFDPAETLRAETRAQGYVRLAELRSEGSLGAKLEAPLRAEKPVKPEKMDKPEKPVKPVKIDTAGAGGQVKKPDLQKPKPTPNFGEIRVADRRMAVRAGRDKDTEFKRLLQAGTRVRVDFQEDGWYAVFDPEEKVRDLSRAWGYGRDKFLVPEKDYTGQPLPEPTQQAGKEAPAKSGQKKTDEAVAYSVLARQTDHLRPLSPVVLRVRLDMAAPPATEALRKIVREIWKAERHKGEDLQVEVLLPGMDQGGLSYAVARFHDDGRLKEFWWREAVLRPKR